MRTICTSRGRICWIVGLLCLPAWTQAATMSLKAVAINGSPVGPTSSVEVGPGGEVTLEILISDWSPEYIWVYQVAIDDAGYSSGSSGTLMPKGWDDKADRPCSDSNDCPEGSWCVADSAGSNGFCESGAFIDADRSDYIFSGRPILAAVDVSSLRYRYGGALTQHGGVPDPGTALYGGTLILTVSDDAQGIFTIDAIDDNWSTFVEWAGSVDKMPVDVEPVTIEVVEMYADVNGDAHVDFNDIASIVDGFTGDFSGFAMEDLDIWPCGGGNGDVDFMDIAAAVSSFTGDTPCGS